MPVGLPCGKPGMGEVMDGAVQQAAQPGRQFMAALCLPLCRDRGGGLPELVRAS